MLTQRKKVGLNVIWLSADKLSRMAIALLVGVLVARYLGPVRYGTLNYALALVSLVSAVVALGLDNIIVRDATKEPERVGTIIATGFVLKLLAGLAGGLALIIYYCLVHKGDDTARAVVLIVSLMLPLQVFDAFDFLFQSRIKAQYTVASRLFAFMATSIIKIWLMWAGAPLTAFALMSTLESALIAVGFLVAVNLYGDKISHWRASRSEAIKLLSNSWPLMLSSLAIVIYLRVDQVFVNEILGNRAEGVYAAAVKVAELWNFLPTMICASCFPVIISAKQSDQRKYILRLRQLYGVIGIVTIVPALITSLYAGLLIKVLYGAKYAGAAQILSVYAWALVPTGLASATTQFIIAENLVYIALLRTTVGALSNIGLNVYLIPRYGPVGAAWATLISYSLVIVTLLAFRQTRQQGTGAVAAVMPGAMMGTVRELARSIGRNI